MAGDHVHQSGFAGAVFSQQGVDLTRPGAEVYLRKRDGRAEVLGDRGRL